MGVDYPEKYGQYLPDASVSQSVGIQNSHRLQGVCFCGLRNAVNDCAESGARNRVNLYPILFVMFLST